MSDQPNQRPEFRQPESGPQSGSEPPRFVPPYGSGAPSQPGYEQGADGQGSYGQNADGVPGQYGRPYNQQANPYAQPGSPYNQQGYYGMPAEPKTLSIASMVCGIASVIMGWMLLPQVAAIITGHMALKREPAGRGMSITGLVLGYLCLLGYGALWLLAIISLAVATTTSSSYSF